MKYLYIDVTIFFLREMFRNLKRRGIDNSFMTSGIMDRISDLVIIFWEEFSSIKAERNQVPAARHTLPGKLKKNIVEKVRSISCANPRKKDIVLFNNFESISDSDLQSAINCLERSFESCKHFHSH